MNRDDIAVMGANSEDRAKGKMKNQKKELFLNIYYLSNIIHCIREDVPHSSCYTLTYCCRSHEVDVQNFSPQIAKMSSRYKGLV